MSDDDITLTADSFTVHASEKVSTGDYENASMSMTIEGSIEGLEVEGDIPDRLRARLHAIQRDLQRDVEEASVNRLRDREFEKWGPSHADKEV